MKCPVCHEIMEKLFTAMVLSKYEVDYFRCASCGLIQTEYPYWLSEAYESAITALDVGLVRRNLKISESVAEIIDRYFDVKGKFLDFAGGYGLFVRLMRDNGYNFYHYDAYCENIFSKYFSLSDLDQKASMFELVTAFEFFEHVREPGFYCEEMLSVSDTILFTTEIVPDHIGSVADWWYFVPETGQHITFYTLRSLEYLARNADAKLYTDGHKIHMITRNLIAGVDLGERKMRNNKQILRDFFCELLWKKNKEIKNKNVSIHKDYLYIKEIISNEEKRNMTRNLDINGDMGN